MHCSGRRLHAVMGRDIAVVRTNVAIIRREVVLSEDKFKLLYGGVGGDRAIVRSQIAF